MPNFADCVVRVAEPRLGKEYWNPTKEIVQDVMTRGAFPRFTGPLSRAERAAIKEGIGFLPNCACEKAAPDAVNAVKVPAETLAAMKGVIKAAK